MVSTSTAAAVAAAYCAAWTAQALCMRAALTSGVPFSSRFAVLLTELLKVGIAGCAYLFTSV